MAVIGFIPARYASTRFPGKPLVQIAGKPMIQWVYEHASKAQSLDRVVVLTDDKRIGVAVTAFGGEVAYTPKHCASGTERIIAALPAYPCTIAVNIQGDEPLLSGADIDRLVAGLTGSTKTAVATLARVIREKERLDDPNVVKVVVDATDHALYFSRSRIPFVRDAGPSKKSRAVPIHQHIGIYAYRTTALRKIAGLQPGMLELSEKLEQLRFLEHGYRIKIVYTASQLVGVDTPADVRIVQKILRGVSR
jgi:3-deoxy-manno-octulosonate cytidylyltransferase (CMP-KDO synthetase)